MKLTTAAQMKELDRQAIEERGIPSIDLMERAAAGVAEAALALLPKRPGKSRGAALCGAGNNGGDGIAAARLLFLKGLKVRAFLVGDYEKLTPDALEETAVSASAVWSWSGSTRRTKASGPGCWGATW